MHQTYVCHLTFRCLSYWNHRRHLRSVFLPTCLCVGKCERMYLAEIAGEDNPDIDLHLKLNLDHASEHDLDPDDNPNPDPDPDPYPSPNVPRHGVIVGKCERIRLAEAAGDGNEKN